MLDRGGNTFRRAAPVLLGASTRLTDSIGGTDQNDFYALRWRSGTGGSSFNFSLTSKRLASGVSVQLLNDRGRVIQQAVRSRNQPLISRRLESGNYYLRISPSRAQQPTRYQLSLSAVPLPAPSIAPIAIPPLPAPSITPITSPPPSLFIDDLSLNEGDRGTSNALFTVRLSAPTTQPVEVNYATQNGTATAGVRYSTLR